MAVVDFVRSLGSFEVEAKYNRVSRLGDRLDELAAMVDWNVFRKLLDKVHPPTDGAGRPSYDCLLLFKMTTLQSWYGMSDEQLEYQVADRFSFQKFLGFPESIPDHTTIWQFREELSKQGIEDKLLQMLNQQLNVKGLKVKKGVIQDATIINADVGKKRLAELKKNSENGGGVSYTPKQLSHIDLDATSTCKNKTYYYGYKAHVKCDTTNQFIEKVEVTTASVHDSKIHLEEKGDGKVYRDRGYAGSPLKCTDVIDKTLSKKPNGKPYTQKQIRANKLISKVRCLGERPFAVIKRVFHGGHVFVKTIARVTTQVFFRCFGYNIYRAFGLHLSKRLALAR